MKAAIGTTDMIKILLMADLHLGAVSPDTGIDDSVRLETFKKIVSLAQEHDILIIAGDLFEGPFADTYTFMQMNSELQSLIDAGIEVIFTAGESEFRDIPNLSNLLHIPASHTFLNNHPMSPVLIEKNGTSLYIYSKPALDTQDVATIQKCDSEGFHLGVFHIDFDPGNPTGESLVYKLPREAVKSLNLDFYALGHNHNFKLYKFQNRIIGAYPGSPEATSSEETGDRYVLSIHVCGSDIMQIKRLAVNTLSLEELHIDCETINSQVELVNTINASASPRTVLRVTISGKRSFPIEGIFNALQDRCADFRLMDNSIPDLHLLIMQYASEHSLRGTLMTRLQKLVKEDGIPGEIDKTILAEILHRINTSKQFTPEELLCESRNA